MNKHSNNLREQTASDSRGFDLRRFMLIGGFLGADKTTAILQFARWVTKSKGWRVAVITNDQANGLVDTALANGGQFAVREIGGGCFCSKSESLVEAMGSFSRKVQPQVLIGEPVGNCTDLVSTVLGPLRTIYRTDDELAPLSILVDPFRAERILKANGTAASGFSEDVNYIYRKQLEEAEIIVVNKSDVFARKRLDDLCDALAERYPKAEVLRVSARTGAGLEEWWERLLTRTHQAEGFMPVDYGVYADGEARLGWVNGEYRVGIAPKLKRTLKKAIEINGSRLLETVVGAIRDSFVEHRVEVAHLKVSLEEAEGKKHPTSNVQLPTSNGQMGSLGAIQWVRTGSEPEFTQRLPGAIRAGRLLLNLRAEAEPEFLSDAVTRAIKAIGREIKVETVAYSAFKPSPPKPTHRLTAA